MCLDIVDIPKKLKKLKSDGNGYKMLYKSLRGKLYFCYYMEKEVPLPIEKWINEKDYRLKQHRKQETISPHGVCYPMGFHVYKYKRHAKQATALTSDVVVPVRFRQAHTSGKQGGKIVIIAKEIFIQKEV